MELKVGMELELIKDLDYGIRVIEKGETFRIQHISANKVSLINDGIGVGVFELEEVKEYFKEYIEDIKVDRISQIKDEIIEFDKVVEKLYKNGNLNSTAYYIIKGFELALNNIIDYKGGIN